MAASSLMTGYGKPYGSTLRGAVKMALLAGWFGLTFLYQTPLLWFSNRFYFRGARFFHDTVRRILGIRVIQRGEVSDKAPTLFVANHTSYLDIPVLGSIVTGSFIAKAEIEGWPVLGALCKLQRTLFIQRSVTQVAGQRDVMRARLEEGQNLMLFAEGTSTDGCHVLPFRSSLFATVQKPLPDGKPIYIQPVSITAVGLDGLPMGRTLRPLYAWYGNMTMGGHGWPMLKLGRMAVIVEFHPTVANTDFKDRKQLAEHCTRMVRSGVERALAGREISLAIESASPKKALAASRPETVQS
ncbi:MAG: lysophospholipid acyltransferase family protein [Alphaproteobacteria bacterium]